MRTHQGRSLSVSLVAKIFETESKMLSDARKALVVKNRSLFKEPVDGFMFRNKFYTDIPGHMIHKGNNFQLHPSLVPELSAHFDKVEASYADRRTCEIGVSHLLGHGIQQNQDIRDALPNFMLEFVPELSSLKRTRPEAYNLMVLEDRKYYEKYQKCRPLLEFYTGLKLLY